MLTDLLLLLNINSDAEFIIIMDVGSCIRGCYPLDQLHPE